MALLEWMRAGIKRDGKPKDDDLLGAVLEAAGIRREVTVGHAPREGLHNGRGQGRPVPSPVQSTLGQRAGLPGQDAAQDGVVQGGDEDELGPLCQVLVGRYQLRQVSKALWRRQTQVLDPEAMGG